VCNISYAGKKKQSSVKVVNGEKARKNPGTHSINNCRIDSASRSVVKKKNVMGTGRTENAKNVPERAERVAKKKYEHVSNAAREGIGQRKCPAPARESLRERGITESIPC